jgi:hypothetical protein
LLHARVAGRCGLARGDSTWLQWAPGAQVWFDAGGTRAVVGMQHAATQFA